MMNLLVKVIKDCSTGIDGVTYNPVRLIGYMSCTAAILTYLGNAVWLVFTKDSFDYVQFATGFSILMTGLIAVGAAEAVKTKTEPPAGDPPKGDKG